MIKRQMTEAMRTANRENARKSATGPTSARGKLMTAKNALKHGILSKKLILDASERAEFDTLHKQLISTFKPCGALETFLVEKLAINIWRDRISLGWEMQDVNNRDRGFMARVVDKFLEWGEVPHLEPMFLEGDPPRDIDPGAQLEVQQLIVTAVDLDSNSRTHQHDTSSRQDQKREGIHAQARIAPLLDTTLRYRTQITRELFATIALLLKVQRQQA